MYIVFTFGLPNKPHQGWSAYVFVIVVRDQRKHVPLIFKFSQKWIVDTNFITRASVYYILFSVVVEAGSRYLGIIKTELL